MGFTTGLLGGFTLTTTVLYLSLQLHTRNRVYQAELLRQQSLILSNIVDPLPPTPPPASREVEAGLFETAKDKWNASIEYEVRKLQTTDWSAVRERLEEGVSSVWQKLFQKSREGADEAAHRIGDAAGAAYRRGKEGLMEGAQKAREGLMEGTERAERFARAPTAKQREG